ncbi:MAG TPA: hypothetical protein VFW33_19760 [Gemmataceae bacterium]|nr:hypothetical protein [Gemmataceae bacterium]
MPPPPPPPPIVEKPTETVPPPLPPAGGAGTTGAAGVAAPPVKPAEAVPTINVQGIEVSRGDKTGKPGGPPPVEVVKPAAPKPVPAAEPEPIVVGVRPSASVPPLSVPASPAPAAVRSARPDVVSYTEESYVTAAGDTFRSISKAKYGTEAYGQALYLFNRSHPLAGDELLQSDALRPKQTVYVPPHEILDSRYAGAAGATVDSTSRRADVAPAPARGYRVAAGGEKVYDIARNLLGDGNRWVEIQKLNPGWNWEVPLPPGVTLQVPGDARLPR